MHTRRQFVAAIGASGLIATAGCNSFRESGPEDTMKTYWKSVYGGDGDTVNELTLKENPPGASRNEADLTIHNVERHTNDEMVGKLPNVDEVGQLENTANEYAERFGLEDRKSAFVYSDIEIEGQNDEGEVVTRRVKIYSWLAKTEDGWRVGEPFAYTVP